MKDINRQILVYILQGERDYVLIELVALTRNCNSYKLNGDIWNRGSTVFDREICTNQDGKEWKIAPLKRDNIPTWVQRKTIKISESAQERYRSWSKKSLGHPIVTKP